ncbi:MAG: 30S ribosomal protein S1 [Deltaproteobacteria bacterium]|nr:30S ribosomal protein S1 [Deltaproteobacteria bacterium]MBW1928566.1 30S ribosomal protein S1 [Deltaproteobacteria bacterium]MBW2025310.1 30S ribosomal protein S1 [Deltaproteobacteria bacterium]MBW2126559.1 30S ribosomal protein S1 [Deltaproteobacteria bacterium]
MEKGTDEIAEMATDHTENPDPTDNVTEDPEKQEDQGPPKEEAAPEGNNFLELYEESLRTIQEGEVVRGEIVQIDKEYVLVDIGYKSEGQIPIHEFQDENGNITAKVGEKVDVLLERKEDEEGIIILSKEKAAKIKVWDQIREIYERDGTIKGVIKSRVKGGLSVDVGLPAFLPGSQVDLRPVRDMDSLVGTEHEFKIVKYNKRRGNIVLSRRAILEAERMALREKTLEKLEDGAVLEGTVKNVTDYGIFVDLGGIDGLVHITDLSWGRVSHPSQLYQIGDKITVKVLHFDGEKERVSLGVKQLTPDPWLNADQKYPVGTKITGRVVSLTDYGAFVEVEPGVEGLIHISEMSWTRKIRHPSQLLKVGDIVDAMVLNIDVERKRISLGMKQVEPNPWDVIAEKYPVGTTIEGKIKNITDFGIFIGIDEGIDGLVHISDISWTKRIKHPSEIYKKGQEVQAIVLKIDKENERFSLGIKQLTPDPWTEIPEKYKPGTRVTGTVTNITDFGIFVELEEGIEGLIHVSEVPKDKRGSALSKFQVDDVIQAQVISVSPQEKKIGLSLRKLEEASDKDAYKSYLGSRREATSNLGELLREEMMNLQRQIRPQEPETQEKTEAQSSEVEAVESVEEGEGPKAESEPLEDTPTEDEKESTT